MNRDDKYWSDFWAEKADPLHSDSGEAYYDRLGDELRLVLPPGFASVLEIGCGNGVFYERLGFDRVQYHGLDYSPAMIESFRKRFPSASVSVSDLRDYEPAAGLDCIFSHGVVQYISPREFDIHLARAAELLVPGGHVVHCGILRRSLRWQFYNGEFMADRRPLLRNLATYASVMTRIRPSMGHWYSMPATRQAAERHGFTTTFYASLLYPYRFHAVMRKRG